LQNSRGIALFGAPGNRIDENTADGNERAGIFLFNSPMNVLSGNKARDTNIGSGISVTSTSDDSVVEHNTTTGNAVHGIELADVTRVLASSNVSNENGMDGIQVSDAGNTLTGNTANGNGNLGIDAVLGVVDGGGNLATGNGNPAQCTYVVCVPSTQVPAPPGANPAAPLPPSPPSAPASRSVSRCSVRGSLETLTDPDGRRVSVKPKPTTINELRHIRAPRVGHETPRLHGVETTTYKLKARLVAMKKDHGGIRLLVSDASRPSRTLAAVFPSLTCAGDSPRKRQIRRARTQLVGACGKASSRLRRLRGRATVTGVGFFRRDNASGLSTAIELDPVLSFRSGRCRRG
jgi:parallel beta-helix repeat protein